MAVSRVTAIRCQIPINVRPRSGIFEIRGTSDAHVWANTENCFQANKLTLVNRYHTCVHLSTIVSALRELTCHTGSHSRLLPATRQRRRSRHNPSQSRYSIRRPSEGSRLSQPCARRGQVLTWPPRTSTENYEANALTTRPRRHTLLYGRPLPPKCCVPVSTN